eukprot:m.119697 g.119697  ORF g.119697 m.119697 type:complete len:101 (+) comp16478_c0_seq10:32-334(+)
MPTVSMPASKSHMFVLILTFVRWVYSELLGPSPLLFLGVAHEDLYTTAFADEANGRIVFTILNAGDGPQSFEVNVAGTDGTRVAETLAGNTLRTYLLPLA